MKNKQDDEFNKEHIILDCLGGKGIDNFVYNVCKKCNSMLGSKVDSWFANDEVTKAYRYMLKINSIRPIIRLDTASTMIFCFTFPKVIDTLLDMPIYMREELTVYIITNGILENLEDICYANI